MKRLERGSCGQKQTMIEDHRGIEISTSPDITVNHTILKQDIADDRASVISELNTNIIVAVKNAVREGDIAGCIIIKVKKAIDFAIIKGQI